MKEDPNAKTSPQWLVNMTASTLSVAAPLPPTTSATVYHPDVQHLLRFFNHAHLPPPLQAVVAPFAALAHNSAATLQGTELVAGLRKLLEAKDCMVRAALPVPGVEPPVFPTKTP